MTIISYKLDFHKEVTLDRRIFKDNCLIDLYKGRNNSNLFIISLCRFKLISKSLCNNSLFKMSY